MSYNALQFESKAYSGESNSCYYTIYTETSKSKIMLFDLATVTYSISYHQLTRCELVVGHYD